jgi:hypothetical protein
VNHIEGRHYILIKEGSEVHLSIPVHKDKILGVGLLKKLIAKTGLTNEEYINLFYFDSTRKNLIIRTVASV